MATNLKEVDVVVVGLGWTGGILSKELTEAGLKVVALERGALPNPSKDFAVPNIRDELRYVVRHELMQNAARDTLTIRNNPSQEALPMRRLGSFLPGEGVGGSATHWSGHTWRWTDMEFKVRSMYEERYGKNFVPADMTIQDWGITYDELEPYYDKFEYTAAVSGKAGNIKGQIQSGGNPFEAPRARDYALPPLTPILASEMFANAAKNACYQTGANATLFFEGRHFNPFMSAGGSNATIDDFNINWSFDRGPHNFVGAYNVSGGFNTVLPIGYRPVPRGTPQWGKEWKAATAKWYQAAMVINAGGSVVANRYNCYDLDSTYRNAFGQPLMRMTFDYHPNEHRMGEHAAT